MGSNDWASYTIVALFLVVRVWQSFINLKFVLCWNMVLFSTLEQYCLIWIIWIIFKPMLKICVDLHFILTVHHNASILGLTCSLLAGEGQGSLQSFRPKFKLVTQFWSSYSSVSSEPLQFSNFRSLSSYLASSSCQSVGFKSGRYSTMRKQQWMDNCVKGHTMIHNEQFIVVL